MVSNALKAIGKQLSRGSERECSNSEDSPGDPEAKPLKAENTNDERYGLFLLYLQPDLSQPGLVTPARNNGSSLKSVLEFLSLEEQSSYHVDIVAIHGLGGTAFKTWTHDNGKLWLRDFAPTRFPHARIYTFGYDSAVAFSKGTGTVRDFAQVLLQSLKVERNKPELKHRPLVLVCHSMGGIIAKLAINMAKNDPDNYAGIGSSMTAIMFLGTPHQGSGTTKYATILARTANAFVIGTQISRLTGLVRTDLLKPLERHETELLSIAEDFSKHAANIQVRSFVEGKKMAGLNTRVVDDHSAFVGAASEQKIPMPGYDHRELCRYASIEDPGFKILLGTLEECLSTDLILQIRSHMPFVHLPLHQNLAFVGQQHILAQLRSEFGGEFGSHQVALYGLGGIGKSQVALQYAYEIKQTRSSTSIFWVFAGSKERFEQDCLEIAKGLHLLGLRDPEINILQLVRDSLERPEFGDWLMIIDNADDLQLLKSGRVAGVESNTAVSEVLFQYVPKSKQGAVIYTTRNKADALRLTGVGNIIHVKEMDIEKSKFLLRSKLCGENSDEDCWLDLIETLGQLPLAIVQAASYIRENSWSVKQYLQHFNATSRNPTVSFLLHEFPDQTREAHTSTGAANSVFKTWMITMQQLVMKHPLAAQVIYLMASYNWQNIPRYLLRPVISSQSQIINRNDISNKGLNPDTSKSEELEFLSESEEDLEFSLDQAIGTLVAYSFVTVAGTDQARNYTLHRLVHLFTRYWLKAQGEDGDTWVSKAVTILSKQFPDENLQDWDKSTELMPHVQEVFSQHPKSCVESDCVWLLIIVSNFLRYNAEIPMATTYIRKALNLLSTIPGEKGYLDVQALYGSARLSEKNLNLEEAEQEYRSVIGLSASVCGSDHPITLRATMSLSNILRLQQRYDDALLLAEDAQRGFDSQQGLTPLDTWFGRAILATILGDMGHHEDALKLQNEVALSLREQFGANHPHSLHALHNIVVTCNRLGRYENARVIGQQIFNAYEKIYTRAGSDHPRTTNIAFHLGLALENQGKYQEAKQYFLRALNRRKQGNSEADSHLHSIVYKALGNYSRQKKVIRKLPFTTK